MRAIWRGAVSFGLVNVPVRVYAATSPKEVRFHQVHASDGGRISYRKVCTVDGAEVASGEISKAYDTGDGLVVLTDADLASLPLASGREIQVEEFVPGDQIDPVLYDRTYYLEPEPTAAKPYALLREALTRTERVAVVTVALRQRESLALLRVRGDVICLQTLLWPAEVREPEVELHADAAASLKPREVAVASQLVESLAADFQPDAHHDRYAEAVRELVSAKVERGEVSRPSAPGDDGSGGEVVDLLAALQRSVEQAAARAAGRPGSSAPAAAKAGTRTTGTRGSSSGKTSPRRARSGPGGDGTNASDTGTSAEGTQEASAEGTPLKRTRARKGA